MSVGTQSDRPFSLDERYRRYEGTIYLRGLHGLVRLLVDQKRADERAGINSAGLISGYPGSPLAGLDSELLAQAGLLREHHIEHLLGLNEDLAATAVFGSQLLRHVPGPRYDGVFGMWFGKAPGVDRTADAFRHGNFRGISSRGGVLAVAGDESDAKSSTLPSDSTGLFADLLMPVLYPGDVQEVLDLGLHAYALSRSAGLAVGFKFVTDVSESAGTAEVSPDRITPVIPQIEYNGVPFVPQVRPNDSGRMMVPVEREIWHARMAMAKSYASVNGLNRVVGSSNSAELGIIAAGRTYFDLLEALRRLGLDPTAPNQFGVRLFKIGMSFPLDEAELVRFATGLREVLVLEEKRSRIESALRNAMYSLADRPLVVGKLDELGRELVPMEGELDAESIARLVAARLARLPGHENLPERAAALNPPPRMRLELGPKVARAPYFCSGCPHSTSMASANAEIVGAGIGCHILGLYMDRDQFGNLVGFTQMGAEGSQWIGVAPFSDTRNYVQNLGDGTFFHSGSLAVRFAVAAKLNVTYKILFNSAVAMTGGQDVTGARSVPDLVSLLLAEGVTSVAVTTEDTKRYRRVRMPRGVRVLDRTRLASVEEEFSKLAGVKVIVHDQQCAAEKRRLRKRGKLETPSESVFINERVCEGCGDCGEQSNCLSVQPVDTEFGRKTAIHQSSCNFDYSCLKGDCPSFVKVRRKPGKSSKVAKPMVTAPDVELLDPVPKVPVKDFALVMTGIGGTGVVTVNQILGTAAVLDGRHVRALDDFGGSQKAGPVVSHLRISTSTPTVSRVGPGQADALLCFDLLVATEERNVSRYRADRTVAIVSTSEVPTGQIVAKPEVHFPAVASLEAVIRRTTRESENVYLDAERIAETVLGNHLASNIVCVGAAYQQGLIPLPEKCIVEAIKLNGAATKLNLEAFRWGRMVVSHPELVSEALARANNSQSVHRAALDSALIPLVDWASGDLRRMIEIRTQDLYEYQDVAYAKSYSDFVRQVAEREALVTGLSTVGGEVAAALHKLMAYKDEYEVARLHLDSAAEAAIASQFGDDVKVYWQLHPPILRAMGLKRKISLGPWFKPTFVMLRGLRRLRGSKFDIFGYTKLRRTERALIEQYRETMTRAIDLLEVANHDEVRDLARLAGTVRGYEHIKERAIAGYEDQLRAHAAKLGIDGVATLASRM